VAARTRTGDVVALSVHGPGGVVDLVVPAMATAADVAQEYAEQLGLPAAPALGTTTGLALQPTLPLADAGVRPGSLLVVVPDRVPAPSTRSRPAGPARADEGGPWLPALMLVVGALALLAGWAAATATGPTGEATVAVLVAGALVAALPVGRWAAARALVAPVYAGAAAYAVVWDPAPERLPTVLGVAALVSALAAAVARSLAPRGSEVLRVWTVVGLAFFLVTMGGALVGASSQLVWAVLLVLAMLAPRFVPGFAVDVPDQLLIDVERLAVTAWSARERPTGRRGRTVVTASTVTTVAARGARTVTAASAGVLAVLLVSAPELLASVDEPADVVGARVLVLLAGGAVLLAARSYRHRLARVLLRLGGLACWAALLLDLAPALEAGAGWWVALGAVLVGLLVVLAAVATGRGWRSAWWSRRAEVLEGLTAALALACLVPASGLFRYLWENVPDV
jgi:hypothetical protein